MNTDVADIIEQVRRLSPRDMLSVQEAIVRELKQQIDAPTTAPEANYSESTTISPSRRVVIPGAVQRTPEEIEELLSSMFTPEEREIMKRTDISNIQWGEKTMAEYINEDREDRVW